MWVRVSPRFPLARPLIDAATHSEMNPSLIDVMELGYANAEKARDICDLVSAQMHLDWIMQAAPEPYALAAILLLPIYMAWQRRPSPGA